LSTQYAWIRRCSRAVYYHAQDKNYEGDHSGRWSRT
jgi:hypothetical protein